MFHHLPAEEKESMLREVRRVLKAGGTFHMLDPAGPDARGGFLSRVFHSGHALKDSSADRIVTLMWRAGFANAEVSGRDGCL
jgi:hypothetical protein